MVSSPSAGFVLCSCGAPATYFGPMGNVCGGACAESFVKRFEGREVEAEELARFKAQEALKKEQSDKEAYALQTKAEETVANELVYGYLKEYEREVESATERVREAREKDWERAVRERTSDLKASLSALVNRRLNRELADRERRRLADLRQTAQEIAPLIERFASLCPQCGSPGKRGEFEDVLCCPVRECDMTWIPKEGLRKRTGIDMAAFDAMMKATWDKDVVRSMMFPALNGVAALGSLGPPNINVDPNVPPDKAYVLTYAARSAYNINVASAAAEAMLEPRKLSDAEINEKVSDALARVPGLTKLGSK